MTYKNFTEARKDLPKRCKKLRLRKSDSPSIYGRWIAPDGWRWHIVQNSFNNRTAYHLEAFAPL